MWSCASQFRVLFDASTVSIPQLVLALGTFDRCLSWSVQLASGRARHGTGSARDHPRYPLFHDFPVDYLEPLASVASVQDYQAGAFAFREGQKDTRLCLIIKGVVSLEFSTPGRGYQRLQTVGAGELLEWSPTLGRTELTATARVVEPTKLLVIDARQLAAICEHNPRFGYEFMRRTALAISQRLSATRLQLLDVYQHELPVGTDRGEGWDEKVGVARWM